MHVIATAGHVDHGKSTLVQALTGTDPDRLEEEKRRGLTIELGFAWVRLPSGREVAIVDVPGHERFIRTMLAGVGSINVVLFVVSANEGWKPQSQEHLDILDLLGVTHAVAVVTKADLVDDEGLAAVVADVRRRLDATSLRGAPVLTVSALAGLGLEELKAQLEQVVDATPPAEDRDRPRLWVDRVFTMKGSGTVVTGTLTGGGLRQDMEMQVLPGGGRARVRGIQSHSYKLAQIGPGNRTALNLVGLEHDTVRRGNAVVRPGQWEPTRNAFASIRFLPDLGHEVSERGAFKVYLGSCELNARLRFLSSVPEPGESGLALLTLAEEGVLDWEDRIVLRDAGRAETLGGGIVLEAHPEVAGKLGPAGAQAVRAHRRLEAAPGGRAAYFGVVLAEEGVLAARDVLVRTGLAEGAARAAGGVWLASTVFSEPALQSLGEALAAALRAHQDANPRSAGMARPAARTVLTALPAASGPKAFDELVGELVRRGVVVADGDVLRTPDFVPALAGAETDELMALLAEARAAPPPLRDLEHRFGAPLVRGLLRGGQLVAVSQDFVYAATTMGWIQQVVRDQIAAAGPFTVAQFRDLVGASRKYVVPLLEFLDRSGFTRRDGDVRVLGPKA